MLLRMTYKCQAAGWMLSNKATQFWSRYALSGLGPLRSYLLEKLRPLVGELHSGLVLTKHIDRILTIWPIHEIFGLIVSYKRGTVAYLHEIY